MVHHKSKGGCQYKFESGEPCGKKINGRGAWQFCFEHRIVGPIQAKKNRDREYSRKRRKADRQEDNFYHFLYYHGLTEPQLTLLVEGAPSLGEQYPIHKDDFHKSILDKFHKIRGRLLNPPAGLPIVAETAKMDTSTLLCVLQTRQNDGFANADTKYLIAHGMELHRDIGKRMSCRSFSEIDGQAKRVRKQWLEQGEILNLVRALFVDVELHRLRYLANPVSTRYLDQSRTWLTAAKHVCAWATSHYSGEHKKIALFLNYYLPLFEITLALDAGELEYAESVHPFLQQRANTVSNTYGTHPVTEIISFLCAVNQAELYLRSGKIDCADDHFQVAEQAFKDMKWRTLESELYVAYVKAGLALARNKLQRQGDLGDLHNYISMVQCHPFLTHCHHLQEFKKRVP